MRLIQLSVYALTVTACGTSSLLPDGGRAQLGCSIAAATVPVKVLGLSRLPVGGASVIASWLSYGVSQTLVTDDRGVALVRCELGPGVVRVRAILNDLHAGPADLTFATGDCVMAATPHELTLRLEAP